MTPIQIINNFWVLVFHKEKEKEKVKCIKLTLNQFEGNKLQRMQNSHVISEPYIFEREREHRLSMRESILFEKLRGTEPLRERERERERGRREWERRSRKLEKGREKKKKTKQKKERVGNGRQRNKEIN
jgi:hypothetical protein